MELGIPKIQRLSDDRSGGVEKAKGTGKKKSRHEGAQDEYYKVGRFWKGEYFFCGGRSAPCKGQTRQSWDKFGSTLDMPRLEGPLGPEIGLSATRAKKAIRQAITLE